MARTPDGIAVREVSVTTRMTTIDTEQVDRQMAARGYSSRSAYIRWLIREDARRIGEREPRRDARHGTDD